MDLRKLIIRRKNAGPEDADDEEEKRGEVRSLPVLTLPPFEPRELEIRTTDVNKGGLKAVEGAKASGDSERQSGDQSGYVAPMNEGGKSKKSSGSAEDRVERGAKNLFVQSRAGESGETKSLVLRRKNRRENTGKSTVGVVSVRVPDARS